MNKFHNIKAADIHQLADDLINKIDYFKYQLDVESMMKSSCEMSKEEIHLITSLQVLNKLLHLLLKEKIRT